MSKIQGMDLEVTAALRRLQPCLATEQLTPLLSSLTTLLSSLTPLLNSLTPLLKLMQPLHSLSCVHLILCSPHPKLLRNYLLSCYKRSSLPTRASVASLASPAFIAIVCSEDKELTLYKSSLVIRVSPTGLRA